MPLAAGFVGILPALGLLDAERDGSPPVHLSWLASIGWSCAVAYFGYAIVLANHDWMTYTKRYPQRFPVSSYKKASGMSLPLTCRLQRLADQALQIIEEQLAFPSGTATAQLISVLHKLPPPDTSNLRRRTGYTELDTDEFIQEPASTDPEEPSDHVSTKPEGWSALLWSFLASGIMTVRA